MTLSDKKADCGGHIDRISDLPSNVINGILEHLNILEIVKTSILSRKWRYRWISVPKLEFEEDFFENCEFRDGPEISRIIAEVLLLHNGPVYKFTLHNSASYDIKIEYLNKWILFLLRSGIRHLELLNGGTIPNKMSSHVFSCQELTYFKLERFNLSVLPKFCGFKNLLELQLYRNRCESDALGSLISGCPLLEKLTIKNCCYAFECIDLSVPALQVLHIDDYQVIKSVCLKKAKNLIDLTLMAHWDYHKRGKVSDLIKGLPNIQRLELGSGYNQALSGGTIPQTLRRSFSSLEYLKLSYVDLNERGEFLYTVSLLKIAPNLVELVIESYSQARTREPDEWEEIEWDGCCLGQLRTVNISVGRSFKYAMSLIQFILANSSSLERLTFDVGLGSKKSHAPMLLSISRDLLQMERASHRAEVEFTHK